MAIERLAGNPPLRTKRSDFLPIAAMAKRSLAGVILKDNGNDSSNILIHDFRSGLIAVSKSVYQTPLKIADLIY
jgi:hypothetical protein